MAVMVAQPTDVVKVRFQAQAKNTLTGGNASTRYTGTWQAYKTIFSKEGIAGLWRGFLPNIGRNAIVNVSEIVCYDLVKEFIIMKGFMRDNIGCHFTSAVVAGFAATCCASPIDVIKTRYMNAKPGAYRGAMDCAIQTFAREGPSAFYKGFMPSFSRLVSWNIVMWLSYEQLKRVVVVKYEEYESVPPAPTFVRAAHCSPKDSTSTSS
jgi:solute carrier family 25 uncoupling protein 8/9